MKAIILAAGTASRLRPLTLHTPKCLLKVGERTLLQRSMDALIGNGIREFVIVTGYLHEKIEDFVNQTYRNSINVSFIHNVDYETTNNIYSLWLARPLADGKEVLLLDSDLLYDPQIVERVLAAKHENILTLIRHELGEEEMKVVIKQNSTANREANAEGTIIEISKTCNPKSAAGESLGIERMGKTYTTALYQELEEMLSTTSQKPESEKPADNKDYRNSFYELAFQRLIAKGHTFSVLDVSDLFSCELDTVEDFENAKQLIPASLF